MNLIQAIVIAIVEGLDRISSHFFHGTYEVCQSAARRSAICFTNLYEIVIQLAAILSVVVLYYKQFFDFKKLSFYFKLIIALIPAVIAGMLLKKHIDAMLANIIFIAIVMIAGGIVLLFVDRLFTRPGNSRSGSCHQ